MSNLVEPEAGRLNGWKDIARHLGKGTRTVQRWEKLYGLPVHRIGREGGEIVFAFRDEIDRWITGQRSGAPPPRVRTGATDPFPSHTAGGGSSSPACCWPSASSCSASGRPSDGRPPGGESGARGEPVLIADPDGDGPAEVLVSIRSADRASRRLFCFEHDGRLRFVRQPSGSRHFGEDEYAEPWLAHQVFVTRRPDGSRRLWAVFTHSLLFPSVLEELEPHGAVRQEYWSNGFIELVAETSWNGRPVVLVGGTNNDFRAASLAVFPPDGVTGAAPSARPAYACRDCPAGGPQAFFLFPSLCSARRFSRRGRDLPRVPVPARAARAPASPRPPVRADGRPRHVPGPPLGRTALRRAEGRAGRPLRARGPPFSM